MSTSNDANLNLRYLGRDRAVEVHGDGQMVVHSLRSQNKSRVHVISILGGTHTVNTLHQLDCEVLHGTCKVKVAGGAEKTLRAGDPFSVPAGKSFTAGSTGAILACKPQPGPGLGSPGNEPNILR